MQVRAVTLAVTEACNFRCRYCRQKRANNALSEALLRQAGDFFLPLSEKECTFLFYGGEPLLVFERIRSTVEHLEKRNRGRRKIKYWLSTNGVLLDEKKLDFLADHNFSLMLSFDGLAQDATRGPGTFSLLRAVLAAILVRKQIHLQLNSVFMPATVGYMAKSVQLFLASGMNDFMLTPASTSGWNAATLEKFQSEWRRVSDILLAHYRKLRTIPVSSFRPETKKGIFVCPAGERDFSLAADGTVWGCHMLANALRRKGGNAEAQKYCFGSLAEFSRNYRTLQPRILKNHERLRQNFFQTPQKYCITCPEVFSCAICPADAAWSSRSKLGHIPLWQCRMSRILLQEKIRFWQKAGLSVEA